MKRLPIRSSALAAITAVVAASLSAPSMAAPSMDLPSLIAALPAGTGYTSLDLCTRTNLSGDGFAHVRDDFVAPVVQPLPSLWWISNKPGIKVSTSAFGILYPRIAAYRPGLGCTVVKNSLDEMRLRAQAFTPVSAGPASSQPWPQGDGPVEAHLLPDALRTAIDGHATTIFTPANTDPAKRTHTFALLVARNGHLVYERYAPGYQRQQPQLGWSMTKSVTAILAGLMAQDGRLALDGPVGLKQWAGTDKEKISWRHLLNMAAGLKWDETGATIPNDSYDMLFNTYDAAGYFSSKPVAYPPGTFFAYSTGASTLAMAALQEKLGGTHQQMYDYYQTRLFAPLGIQGGVIEPDYTGTPIGGARGVLRPVDWTRLGQLIANGGTWGGQRLMSSDWVDFMKAPSPANDAYAGSLWNRNWKGIPADIGARLPPDTVYFSGLLGQFVVIIPSRHLVVTHMGVSHDLQATSARLFGAIADWVDQGL